MYGYQHSRNTPQTPQDSPSLKGSESASTAAQQTTHPEMSLQTKTLQHDRRKTMMLHSLCAMLRCVQRLKKNPNKGRSLAFQNR